MISVKYPLSYPDLIKSCTNWYFWRMISIESYSTDVEDDKKLWLDGCCQQCIELYQCNSRSKRIYQYSRTDGCRMRRYSSWMDISQISPKWRWLDCMNQRKITTNQSFDYTMNSIMNLHWYCYGIWKKSISSCK